MNLKGKKLMYLGGDATIDIVSNYAKEQGFLLATAGSHFSDKVKGCISERYEVDVSNADDLIKVLKTSKPDGIFVLGNENVITSAIKASEETGVHFYLNSELWNKVQNKVSFKALCEKFSVPTIKGYEITKDNFKGVIPTDEFPVVIKPADSCGSNGIFVCNTETELETAINKSFKFSRTHTFLCEKYMTCNEFTAYYFVRNGKVTVWEIKDRISNHEQKGLGGVGICVVSPSKYSDIYFNKIHDNVCRMIESTGYKNGPLFMQGFVDGDTIRFYDPGLRFSGGLAYTVTEKLLGTNPLVWMINEALCQELTTDSEFSKLDWRLNGKFACILSVLLKTGKITSISGLDEVEKISGVFHIHNPSYVGREITAAGTLDQLLLRVYAAADNREAIEDAMYRVYNTVKVTDKNGNDMVLRDGIVEKHFKY